MAFKNKKGVALVLWIFSLLAVVYLIFSVLEITFHYANSETANKIVIANDFGMMVNTLVGLPGDAVVEFPRSLGNYTITLTSSTVNVLFADDSESKTVTREFILPQDYNVIGYVIEKERVCLEKKENQIILKECET
ncbi:MAG: hypothetical protein ABIG93_01745 [archaeon]